MSYQLYFRPRRARPSRRDVEAWLVDRPWWQLGADRASYYDPATGVFFGIDWLSERAPTPMKFELELFLPETFALEALPELVALVEAFALDVEEPGRPAAPLEPDVFLTAWRDRNTESCGRQVGELDAPNGTLPRAANIAIWRWNKCREAYVERLSTVEMIPCLPAAVRLAVPHGDRSTVLTVAVWTGGGPLVLPEVDVVLASESPDLAPQIIPQIALRPWLDRFPRRQGGYRFGRSGVIHDCGLPHWVVDYDTPPVGLIDALRSLGSRRRLVPVGPHEVLDRETVRTARERATAPPTADRSLTA